MKKEDLQKILSKPGISALNPQIAVLLAGQRREAAPSATVEVTKTVVAVATSQETFEEERMNKLETAFWAHLQTIRPVCKIKPVTLRLASDVRYTPDFYSIGPNGEVEFWETKGFMRDDARKSLLVAARTYREFKFYLVTRPRKSIEFTIKHITP